jgi:hypothetical protein
MSGDLKVVLSLVDDFTKSLTGIETEMGAFGRHVDSMVSNIQRIGSAFAGAFAVHQVEAFIQKGIDFGDTIAEMSRRTGLNVEQTQIWNHVLTASGTSLDNMQKAFTQLSVKAFDGNAAFKALGITLKDNSGTLKDTGTLFGEVVLRLADIQSPTERAAAAQKIFGKSSAEVLAVVGEGKDKIREMIGETREYSLLLDDKTVAALKNVKEKQKLWNDELQVFTAKAAVIAGPLIENWISGANSIATAVEKWARSYGFLNEQIDKSSIQMKAYQDNIAEVKELIEGAKGHLAGEGLSADADQDVFKTPLPGAPTEVHKQAVDNYILSMTEIYHKAGNVTREEEKKQIALWEAGLKRLQDGVNELNKKAPAQAPLNPDDFKKDKTNPEKEERERLALQYGDISSMPQGLQDELKRSASYVAAWKKEHDEKLRIEKITDKKLQDELEDNQEFELRMLKDQLNYEKQMAQERLQNAMNLADAMGTAFGNMFTGQKGAFKAGLKDMLGALVDFGERSVMTYLGIDTAKNIMEGGIGWFKAGLEIAAIKGAAALIKGQIAGFADGTRYAPGGMAWVGERGPEVMYVPRGSQIYNNSESKKIASQGNITVHLYDQYGTLSESFTRELRAGGYGTDRVVSALMQKMKKSGVLFA